ncbi:nucleotidyltransferase family protein [uncultured Selenomonas sp.]|uniref:nucleotidyltransferase family protein n=1 Tax=uncultured Selenomonas sp. TaxID=159275 RepID=UPI0025F2602E|nr:nucleotidyltransferase domain-containing protein [uncultured Selenomonas sp.]
MNLRDDIKAGIIALAKQHGLEKVLLFGSRARGDNWERSDIDLAARGGDIVRFTLDVDDVIPTLLMFDVVNLDGPVQPELLESIRRDGIVLYEAVEDKQIA